MASAPKLRSIPAEALQEAPEWFQKFLEYHNPFLNDVGNAFDALLRPNGAMQIEPDVKFTMGAAAEFPGVKFKNRLSAKPRVVLLGQILPTSASESLELIPTTPIWRLASNGDIKIEYIGGLDASVQYRATFVVLP